MDRWSVVHCLSVKLFISCSPFWCGKMSKAAEYLSVVFLEHWSLDGGCGLVQFWGFCKKKLILVIYSWLVSIYNSVKNFHIYIYIHNDMYIYTYHPYVDLYISLYIIYIYIYTVLHIISQFIAKDWTTSRPSCWLFQPPHWRARRSPRPVCTLPKGCESQASLASRDLKD